MTCFFYPHHQHHPTTIFSYHHHLLSSFPSPSSPSSHSSSFASKCNLCHPAFCKQFNRISFGHPPLNTTTTPTSLKMKFLNVLVTIAMLATSSVSVLARVGEPIGARSPEVGAHSGTNGEAADAGVVPEVHPHHHAKMQHHPQVVNARAEVEAREIEAREIEAREDLARRTHQAKKAAKQGLNMARAVSFLFFYSVLLFFSFFFTRPVFSSRYHQPSPCSFPTVLVRTRLTLENLGLHWYLQRERMPLQQPGPRLRLQPRARHRMPVCLSRLQLAISWDPGILTGGATVGIQGTVSSTNHLLKPLEHQNLWLVCFGGATCLDGCPTGTAALFADWVVFWPRAWRPGRLVVVFILLHLADRLFFFGFYRTTTLT
jgi:hypothetical protein